MARILHFLQPITIVLLGFSAYNPAAAAGLLLDATATPSICLGFGTNCLPLDFNQSPKTRTITAPPLASIDNGANSGVSDDLYGNANAGEGQDAQFGFLRDSETLGLSTTGQSGSFEYLSANASGGASFSDNLFFTSTGKFKLIIDVSTTSDTECHGDSICGGGSGRFQAYVTFGNNEYVPKFSTLNGSDRTEFLISASSGQEISLFGFMYEQNQIGGAFPVGGTQSATARTATQMRVMLNPAGVVCDSGPCVPFIFDNSPTESDHAIAHIQGNGNPYYYTESGASYLSAASSAPEVSTFGTVSVALGLLMLLQTNARKKLISVLL